MSRAQVEDFLYAEAELLDTWQLEAWLALFTEDATYQVPSSGMGANASPDEHLFYIADDRMRLNQRVARLAKKTAYAEWPRSFTRHLVHNVRIVGEDDSGIEVRAAFVVHRFKDGNSSSYIGGATYRLLRHGDSFQIRSKLCALDSEVLRPQGRISILL
jgi:p-cumate 2,3-dioxygenase subunit beta